MDLRIQKTRAAIKNAYLELKAKKHIEKITIKELAETAVINKATFYQHYKDIYDLADKVEAEAVDEILKTIPHPDYLITNTDIGFNELINAIIDNKDTFDVLFSGSRSPRLAENLEISLKKLFYTSHPDLADTLKTDMLLTVLIHGTFVAFTHYQNNVNRDEIFRMLGDINNRFIAAFREELNT